MSVINKKQVILGEDLQLNEGLTMDNLIGKIEGTVITHIQNYSVITQSKYMLLAGWEVRIGKNCDRGLENAARGRRPRAAFSSLRSQFFTIRTDPKPDNNMFNLFSCGKLAYK